MINIKTKAHIFSCLAILFIALASSSVEGQTHDDATHEEGHEFKHFRVAVNLAHAYIPGATDEEGDFAIIPVYGMDLQYWFNPHWALGLKSDIEIAKYTLTGSDESTGNVLRENPIIVSLPVYYSPWEGGLAFFAGPGIELEDHHNFGIFRLGIGYEFHLPGHWDFAPEFVYDLKDGTHNSFTIALGVGKRF